MDIQSILDLILHSEQSMFILLGIAAILFIAGVVLIIKGTQDDDSQAVDIVVPISDPKQIKELAQEYQKSTADSTSEIKIPIIEEQTKMEVTQSPEPNTIEPITKDIESNHDETKVKNVAVNIENVKPQDSNDQTIGVEKQNPNCEQELQDTIAHLKKELEDAKERDDQKIKDLEQKNQELNKALKAEVSSKDQTTLNNFEKDLIKEKDERIQKAEGSLIRLTGENHRLSKELKELKNKYTGAQESEIADPEIEKQKHQQLADLQNQLTILKNENEQLKSDAGLTENLKKENEQIQHNILESAKLIEELKAKIAQPSPPPPVPSKDPEDLVAIAGLKKEKEDLLTQLKIQELKVQETQKELQTLTSANEQKIIAAQSQIEELQTQIKEIESQAQIKEDVVSNESLSAVTESEKEKDALAKDCEQLKESNAHLEKFNKQLLDKEQVLHYELSKIRAESIGLEKICEDFKQQIEKMSTKS